MLPFQINLPLSIISTFWHNFSISIIDSTNNKETTGLYTLTVDYTKPDIDTIVNESYNETTHIIRFNATEAINATIFYGNESGVYNYNYTNNRYIFNCHSSSIKSGYIK